jgi:hypothetical protein
MSGTFRGSSRRKVILLPLLLACGTALVTYLSSEKFVNPSHGHRIEGLNEAMPCALQEREKARVRVPGEGGPGGGAGAGVVRPEVRGGDRSDGSARFGWGNPASLPDHYARHGADVGAVDAADYTRKASEFLGRARVEGLPAKRDADGVLRVYDPRSRAFGAYNRDGSTRTFFRVDSPDYFEHQPGRAVDLRAEGRG